MSNSLYVDGVPVFGINVPDDIEFSLNPPQNRLYSDLFNQISEFEEEDRENDEKLTFHEGEYVNGFKNVVLEVPIESGPDCEPKALKGEPNLQKSQLEQTESIKVCNNQASQGDQGAETQLEIVPSTENFNQLEELLQDALRNPSFEPAVQNHDANMEDFNLREFFFQSEPPLLQLTQMEQPSQLNREEQAFNETREEQEQPIILENNVEVRVDEPQTFHTEDAEEEVFDGKNFYKSVGGKIITNVLEPRHPYEKRLFKKLRKQLINKCLPASFVTNKKLRVKLIKSFKSWVDSVKIKLQTRKGLLYLFGIKMEFKARWKKNKKTFLRLFRKFILTCLDRSYIESWVRNSSRITKSQSCIDKYSQKAEELRLKLLEKLMRKRLIKN